MLREEQNCQIKAMAWLKKCHPDIESDTYHFANERKCSVRYGYILKLMGVKRGVLDLFSPVSRHGKYGLWIEIKVKNNYPSKEQKEFMERQLKNNYAVACCWGLEAIKLVYNKYLTDDSKTDYFDKIIYEKSAQI